MIRNPAAKLGKTHKRRKKGTWKNGEEKGKPTFSPAVRTVMDEAVFSRVHGVHHAGNETTERAKSAEFLILFFNFVIC